MSDIGIACMIKYVEACIDSGHPLVRHNFGSEDESTSIPTSTFGPQLASLLLHSIMLEQGVEEHVERLLNPSSDVTTHEEWEALLNEYQSIKGWVGAATQLMVVHPTIWSLQPRHGPVCSTTSHSQKRMVSRPRRMDTRKPHQADKSRLVCTTGLNSKSYLEQL